MKKIVATCFLLFTCSVIFAQYKKANFFSKEGRYYELDGQLYNMGDGKGSVMGVNLTFGREEEGKHLFTNWQIRIIPSFDFSYITEDDNNAKVTVTGKARTHYIYAANWGYFLLPNEAERVFKPYLTAGFNILLIGGIKDTDHGWDNVKMQLSDRTLNAGIGGGAGAFINIGGNFSLKAEAGYNYQWNYAIEPLDSDYKSYFMYTSHAYASAGIRYMLTD